MKYIYKGDLVIVESGYKSRSHHSPNDPTTPTNERTATGLRQESALWREPSMCSMSTRSSTSLNRCRNRKLTWNLKGHMRRLN